jgi:hypothetical protein
VRVGILDLLATPARGWREALYHLVMTKQYASVTPQAIAVWCRQLGHATFYGAYYGLGDPRRLLPRDLDVVFVSTYTQASALAYALAKLYRCDGVTTVVGGPHALAFPADCLRFFDLVVGECSKSLVADILRGSFAPGSAVASATPFGEVPTVEERLPEIRASAFAWRRYPFAATTIPLLASTGCPYACDFCVDAARPYRQLSLEQLAIDLAYVARRLPGVMVGFHDPNFAVKFDAVLDALETIPPAARSPYVVETSLSILGGGRARRLRETNCVSLAPGVESWAGYASKAGVGRLTGSAKVDAVVERFTALSHAVPYLQANFLFGLDGAGGEDQVALTKAFMTRTPFVWPVVNIPHPFGGSPLFDRCLAEGRILTAMPFSFYYSPYVVTVPTDASLETYYDRLIDLFGHFTSGPMLARRLATAASPFVRLLHVVRTGVKRRRLRVFHRLRALLRADPQLRRFHEGRSRTLPEYYHREYERMLGPFAPLLSRRDRLPCFDALPGPRDAELPVVEAPGARRVHGAVGLANARSQSPPDGAYEVLRTHRP